MRPACCVSVLVAVVALVMAGGARADQRCIYHYWSYPIYCVEPPAEPGGCLCGSGHDWWYNGGAGFAVGCETGEPNPGDCLHSDEFLAWNAARTITLCSEYSGFFNDCEQAPAPDDCDGPVNNQENCLGDPVDLTTGALEQSVTDLALESGLEFSRHYASNDSVTIPSPMGKRWRHSLDWRLRYDKPADFNDFPRSPRIEIVTITRPFEPKISFVRRTSPPPENQDEPWMSSVNGAGGLTGDPAVRFDYVDDDGTRVRFDKDGSSYLLKEIQPTGQPPIAVEPQGSLTTFKGAHACILVTTSGGRVAAVESRLRSGTDCIASPMDRSWSFAYLPDGSGCLDTVSGVSPADSSKPLVFDYDYDATGVCDGKLSKITRTEGAGANASTVVIGAWKFSGAQVRQVDEPALDQPLCLRIAPSGANQTASVCELPASGVCSLSGTTQCGQAGASPAPLATFTVDDGRIKSASGTGGPGVEIPFQAATFTAATSNTASGLWDTKTDRNGIKAKYENYTERGRPGRVTEGWRDLNGNDVVDGSEPFLRRREYLYHDRLGAVTQIKEQSVLNSADWRYEIYDYDSDLDDEYNEAPTDRLYQKIVKGWTLNVGGAQTPFTDRTTYTYTDGRLSAIAGPRASDLTKIYYDPTTGMRSKVWRYTNGAGSPYLEWLFEDFDAHGNPRVIKDPNWSPGETERGIWRFTYDDANRVKTAKPPYPAAEVSGPAVDSTISFTYDVDGNLDRIAFPNDTDNALVWLDMGYDAKGNLRFLADSKGNAIVYDYERSRAIRERRYTGFQDLANPGTPANDPTGMPVNDFEYDTAGRLAKAFNPLFQTADQKFASFGHDGEGNLNGVTDENGLHDTLIYDELNRLIQIQQVRQTATIYTTFSYDHLSNIWQVIDGENKTTLLLHDDRGNLVEVQSPDTGTTRFLHDAAGNAVTKREAAGTSSARSTFYSYDGLGRLLQVDLPTEPDWTFTYDAGSAAFNRRGRLAYVTNGQVTTTFNYTARGDVQLERTTIENVAYDVTYEYDAAGNRTTLIAPSGRQVVTDYSGLRPSRLVVTAGSRTEQVTGISWHPFGPRIEAMLPPDSINGNQLRSKRTINAQGQVAEIKVEAMNESPPLALLHKSYVYNHTVGGSQPNDPGPSLDRIIDHLDPAQSRYFYYRDPVTLNNLGSLTGVSDLQDYDRTFRYDQAGNRVSDFVLPPGTTWHYESGTNRLDSATGSAPRDYAHDAFGNRIYDGEAAYAGNSSLVYDELNRLKEARNPANGFATLATYTYDAFGRRVKKDPVGSGPADYPTLYFYDSAGHLIEEVVKVPDTQFVVPDEVRSYFFLEDELLGIVDGSQPVGTSAFIAPGARRWEIDPTLTLVVLALASGAAAGFATRRWPVGIAAAGSWATLVFLCAGVPGQPFFATIHTDPLGTPLVVTRNPAAFGTPDVIWRATYEPFGEADVDENPDNDSVLLSLNVRFPGQYFDAETRFHFNFFRTYDPNTGRYLQPDPIGLAGGANQYSYARNNPLSFIDPSGLVLENVFYDKHERSAHRKEAVSIDEFASRLRGRTLQDLRSINPGWVSYLGSRGGPVPRYVLDPASGNDVIDMTHFLSAGPWGELIGLLYEVTQIGRTDSAFDKQDFFSNALGSEFFRSRYYDPECPENLAAQIRKFLRSRVPAPGSLPSPESLVPIPMIPSLFLP